jgi:hypothetical protein
MVDSGLRFQIYDGLFVDDVDNLDITGAMDLAYDFLELWGGTKARVKAQNIDSEIRKIDDLSQGERLALRVAGVYRELAFLVGERSGFEKDGEYFPLKLVEAFLAGHRFPAGHISLVKDIIEFSGEPFSSEPHWLGKKLNGLGVGLRTRLRYNRRQGLDGYFENP